MPAQSLCPDQPQVKSRNQNLLPSSKTQTDSMYKRSSVKKASSKQSSTIQTSSRPQTSAKPTTSYGVKPQSALIKKSTDKSVRRKQSLQQPSASYHSVSQLDGSQFANIQSVLSELQKSKLSGVLTLQSSRRRSAQVKAPAPARLLPKNS